MTREEAIQVLKEYRTIVMNCLETKTPAFDMAIDVLSADAVQRWIPCSERLPKEKQEVYVTVYFIEGDTGGAYGYFDGFGKWHLYSTVEGTLNSGYEVIAWMPLPEPYREDGGV